MDRLTKSFQSGRTYIGYVTAGDPSIARTENACLALIAGGIQILEIGVPFSDPIADGPIIQAASTRALSAGTTLDDVFRLIHALRQKTEIPIVLFSYWNPILAAGDTFYQRAKSTGVDGCLIVDLPLEESQTHLAHCHTANIDPILLISPSTPLERVQEIQRHGRGFLYYVCRTGTTGIKNALPAGLTARIQAIQSVTTLPVAVGFGIANRRDAEAVLAIAPGVVIGSLFVDAIAKGYSDSALTQLAQSITAR